MTNEKPQIEILELPSKGECYRSKTSRLPVAYLTADDENIIFSEKLRENGTMCDVLLKGKVLDKDFNIEDLCISDRQAILLWLRRTGYGDTYTYNNELDEEKQIDLSTIKFKEFDNKGDEQGHFEYVLPSGEIIKYRLLTHRDEIEISRWVEHVDNEIISGKDMSEIEYYCKVSRYILFHQVISVNGSSDINEWLDNLHFVDLRHIVEYLQSATPCTTSEISLELNEDLFYNLK